MPAETNRARAEEPDVHAEDEDLAVVDLAAVSEGQRRLLDGTRPGDGMRPGRAAAQLLDRAWWEEDDEWLASYDEKQYISTFNFHRLRIWATGGLMFIIQANGHAKGLGALTPMAAADAGAKCGAERATPGDPIAVRLRCGMVTVEAVDERDATAPGELVYTPASTGTKLYTPPRSQVWLTP